MDSLLASCSLPTQFYRSNVTTSCATAISSIGEITLEPYVLKSPIMFSGLKLCSNLDEQQGRMSDTRSPRPGDASLDIKDTDSIEQIDKSLKQITGKSCHLLVDTLCQEYIQSGDYSQIWKILREVEGLEMRVCTLYWQYWDGTSDDPTKNIIDRVRSIARVLEDLLMHAMDGTDVAKMYARGAFLFQNSSLDTIH